MKSIIRCLVMATVVVSWLGVAAGQPAPAQPEKQGTPAPTGSTAPAAGQPTPTAPAAGQPTPTAPTAGQPTPTGAGTAPASGQATGVPPVQPADKGAAQGTGPTGAQSPGPSTQPGAAGGAPGIAWFDALANKPIEEEGNFWMPKSVNLAADDSDLMFYSVLALSAFFFLAILVAVVWLTWKYRHRPGHKPEP